MEEKWLALLKSSMLQYLLFCLYSIVSRSRGAHSLRKQFSEFFRAQKCKIVGHALFQDQLSSCYDCSRLKRSCNTQGLRLPKVRRDTAHFLAQLSNNGVSSLDLRRKLILNLHRLFISGCTDPSPCIVHLEAGTADRDS